MDTNSQGLERFCSGCDVCQIRVRSWFVSLLIVVAAALVWWSRPAPRPSFDDPEIARAAQETRFALALVGELGRRAALDEVLGRRVVTPTVDGVADALRKHLGSEGSVHENTVPEGAPEKGANG
jgi:hypothetical protein